VGGDAQSDRFKVDKKIGQSTQSIKQQNSVIGNICLEAVAIGDDLQVAWGNGLPKRKFLCVDGAAKGILPALSWAM
jgi:hypothetical protein